MHRRGYCHARMPSAAYPGTPSAVRLRAPTQYALITPKPIPAVSYAVRPQPASPHWFRSQRRSTSSYSVAGV